MSRFLFLSLQDMPQNVASCPNVCICCLDRGNEMIRLDSCKHSGFLLYHIQLKSTPYEHLVCYRCHSMLLKIDKFRLLVEESARILSTQAQDIPLELAKRNAHLKIQPTQIVDSTMPTDVTKPTEHTAQERKEEFEVKTESDHHFSGSESDLPLVKIKVENAETKQEIDLPKTKKNLRKRNLKKKTKCETPNAKAVDKYKGLFKLVHLSDKEIKEERKKLAEDENYLRLPYKCASCIVGFDYQTNLEEHNQKKHSAKEGFKCETCLSVLGTEPSYRDHVRRHAKRYECSECGRRVVTLESARSHCRRLHGAEPRPRVLACRHCHFTTERLRVYRYHLDKHKEKPQCTECGRTFINASILKNHMLTLHGRGSRVFSCQPCGKRYASRSGLSAHQSDYHKVVPNERAFCEKCGSWFKSQRNLDTHLRISRKHRSASDDKYKCGECSKSFHIKSLVEEHIRFVHLKDTQYKCALCGNKSFINKAQLKKHVKVVHEKDARPRDKICDYCGRGFTCNSILRTHIRTHTGERPLRCERCAACFAHPGALYTHTRLLHGGS